MELIKEIKNEVVSADNSLTSVLRKAKIAAYSLQNEELKHWVEAELNGYTGSDKLPPYRTIVAPVYGTFNGPGGSSAKNIQLPTYDFPDSMGENPREIPFGNPIKEIESLAKKDNEDLRQPWPTEVALMLRDEIAGMSGGMVLNEVYQRISSSQLVAILDAVRNRLLTFVLELQEVNPSILESDEALREISEDVVQEKFDTTIKGSNNVIAIGNQVKQKVTQEIEPRNIDSLMDYLESVGLEQEDLKDLQEAIGDDAEPVENEPGERVKSWIWEISEKAYKGILDVGPSLIIQAIMSYYGL